jgi:hypothetical protein
MLALHRRAWYFSVMTKTRKTTMKTTSQKRMTTQVPVVVDVPLSPHWAFVVQFRAVPGGPVYAAGRIEHLVSGRTNHFQSLKELSAYLAGALRTTKA